jgi:hypothetical protein
MALDSRNDPIFSHWGPHVPMHDPLGILPIVQQAGDGKLERYFLYIVRNLTPPSTMLGYLM